MRVTRTSSDGRSPRVVGSTPPLVQQQHLRVETMDAVWDRVPEARGYVLDETGSVTAPQGHLRERGRCKGPRRAERSRWAEQ